MTFCNAIVSVDDIVSSALWYTISLCSFTNSHYSKLSWWMLCGCSREHNENDISLKVIPCTGRYRIGGQKPSPALPWCLYVQYLRVHAFLSEFQSNCPPKWKFSCWPVALGKSEKLAQTYLVNHHSQKPSHDLATSYTAYTLPFYDTWIAIFRSITWTQMWMSCCKTKYKQTLEKKERRRGNLDTNQLLR